MNKCCRELCLIVFVVCFSAIQADAMVLRVFDPSNGHYYQKVAVLNSITWYDAESAAENMTFNGKVGHLATITSASEESFIVSHLGSIYRYWIGGYQPAGSSEPAGGWRWVTGEPWTYTNWNAVQPDNCANTEHGLQIWLPNDGWNDNTMWYGQPGFIVEYDDWRPEPMYNPGNGHYYQAMFVSSGASWYDSKVAAEKLAFKGAKGHLVTITSKSENDFVASLAPVASGYWIGGYQPSGSSEPAGGWQWVTGEPWTYANWDQSEPNNSLDDDGTDMRLNGMWNDRNRNDSSPRGYIVEYEPAPIFVDDFNDNMINTAFWDARADSGVTVNETNQRLEMSFLPTASGDQFGAAYTCSRKIRGDFDIQVDYELLDWPVGNGVRVGLVPTWWSVQRSSWGKEVTSPADAYVMDSYFGHGQGSFTNDKIGRLRIVRVGSVISSYYYKDNNWQLIHSYDYGSDGMIDVPWFNISVWSHDYAFGGNSVKIAFDNFTINRGELIPGIIELPIGSAKAQPDGSIVSINNAVVTAVGLEPGCVFIESPDRSSGIKVVTDRPLNVGQKVTVNGALRRIDGEWQILSPSFISVTDGDALAPVGVTSRTVGNDREEKLNYCGINTTGMLVRMAGKVTAVVPGDRVVYVDDGGSYEDGLGPFIGIRVHVPDSVTLPSKGNRVIITGISRVEKHILTDWGEVNGVYYNDGTTIYVPSLWVRNADDIRRL